MRVRSAAPLALAAIVAIASIGTAEAAPKKKKDLKKTYTVTMTPFPDLTEEEGCSGAARSAAMQVDIKPIKVTGPGTLSVKVTKFTGDWDMALWNAAGASVSEGSGTITPNTSTDEQTETLKYKSKKAQTLNLRVCNFLGSQSATVSYTYVYS
jgi:hypothetical protein